MYARRAGRRSDRGGFGGHGKRRYVRFFALHTIYTVRRPRRDAWVPPDMTLTIHGNSITLDLFRIRTNPHAGDLKGGRHASPGSQPVLKWSWVTAWPGPGQREPPRRPSVPLALSPTPAPGPSVTPGPRRRARGRSGAAPAGPGGGGGGGGSGGVAGDAGCRAAAVSALRDAHNRVCGHGTGHTRCQQGHRMGRMGRVCELWRRLRTFLLPQKLPPIAP